MEEIFDHGEQPSFTSKRQRLNKVDGFKFTFKPTSFTKKLPRKLKIFTPLPVKDSQDEEYNPIEYYYSYGIDSEDEIKGIKLTCKNFSKELKTIYESLKLRESSKQPAIMNTIRTGSLNKMMNDLDYKIIDLKHEHSLIQRSQNN